ncbi:hypothetical protein N0V83_006392 [Neocucurbitaria cava]|uniref:Uncharacterized protein n=1 Tax=Neocucurbitaria cava TaxID=798079 RepID=A0A9W8Y637_9PLEO|nr:hypothetical protein N0V83_006392 [Neocucurbitaria cava]
MAGRVSPPSWKDLGYSDEAVSLEKYKIWEEHNNRIEKGTNVWIITIRENPFWDEAYQIIGSGRGYTTGPSTVKWCLTNKRWFAQGYGIRVTVDGTVDGKVSDEKTLEELKRIIKHLDTNAYWFGQSWPTNSAALVGRESCPWGMSFDLKIERTRYEHGRHSITEGEKLFSLTLQEEMEFGEDDIVESIEKD